MFELYVGVDPGASGALAFYHTGQDAFSVEDMPYAVAKLASGKKRKLIDSTALHLMIEDHASDGGRINAFVEKVSAMPGQGVTSMFSFGRAVGVLDGVFGAMGVGPVWITPQEWQRHFNLLGSDKAEHRERAGDAWPDYRHLFARKKDDGRADAALLLHYGLHRSGIDV